MTDPHPHDPATIDSNANAGHAPAQRDRAVYGRLLGHVKPYKWAFIGSCVAMAFGGLVDGSFAWFLKNMLGTVFVDGNPQYAAWAAIGIVIVFFLSGMSHFIAGYGMMWVGHKVILDFRNAMFHRLIHVPASYYDQHTSGTLMSKVSNDVIGVQEAATNALNAIIRGTFTLITLLVTMLVLNWKLTLIMFVTIPILGLVISVFGKRLRVIARGSQVAHAQVTDVLAEAIRGQRVVKIFGGQQYEGARFDGAAGKIRHYAMKHALAASAATPFTHIVVAAAIGLIVYLAASRTLGVGMPVEDFVAYIVAAAGLVPQIKGLASVSEKIQKGLAAAESVFALIDAPLEEDKGTVTLSRATGQLEFNNVSMRYPSSKTAAIDDFSLKIAPGETIALVGPSGSGKTSLINLLPRFFKPASGAIHLDGHALEDIKLADLRRQIALVSQDVVLFNDTVAANITYGHEGTPNREDVMAAARAANCLDFIDALPDQFEAMIGENGARLSGGQRQRLAIARALFKNAPILLLDEATSALDSESERAVQVALDTLMKGRTTLVVAHRLSTIENASRIVVMERGKIVEIGTHAELIALGGLYKSLHRLQFAA
jgi:ATP-binding cassette, subfamily B, bacterial MsbA